MRFIFIVVVASLTAGPISGRSLGTEPLPQPTPAGNRLLESLFPVPRPAVMESPQGPALQAAPGTPCHDANCQCSACCSHRPVQRMYRSRVKPALQASHWGYPELFHERPFGSYVQTAVCAQVENGLVAQMVLYRFDFVMADGRPGVELNRSGRVRLEKVATLAALGLCPIVIEVDEDNPPLNSARRAQVLAELRQAAPSFPEEQLVVGRPLARGLAGAEGVAIKAILQQQVETMGGIPSYSGGKLSGIGSGITGGSGGGQPAAGGS